MHGSTHSAECVRGMATNLSPKKQARPKGKSAAAGVEEAKATRSSTAPAKGGALGRLTENDTTEPGAALAAVPAGPSKLAFLATVGFLAPLKPLCRCLESPIVRGLRLNVSRIALALWSAETKKSIKMKAALVKMTPEGRAKSGAWRSWYAKLLEDRKMKAAVARMSPDGRAKIGFFTKWITDQRERKKQLRKLQKIARKISPDGMACRAAIGLWLVAVAEARKMRHATQRTSNALSLTSGPCSL